jgi:hypothetical protein
MTQGSVLADISVVVTMWRLYRFLLRAAVYEILVQWAKGRADWCSGNALDLLAGWEGVGKGGGVAGY